MDAFLHYNPNEEETYYEVLGCDRMSTVEQINVEYKLKALKYHPDKNPGNASAAEEFRKLQQARDILVNPQKRKEYDTWLASGLYIPFDEWARMDVKTSMHWSVVRTDPMIKSNNDHENETQRRKYGTCPKDQGSSFDGWKQRTNNDIINKFRNYEI